MAHEVYISHSPRDREFVQRLAAELGQRIQSVWFDPEGRPSSEEQRSSQIDGIENCKVFILVISPRSARSEQVMWELAIARRANRRVIPVMFATTRMPADLAEYLHSIQYVDLRQHSYADNFELLVEGLIFSGVTPKGEVHERQFLRQPTRIPLRAVLSRLPGWGCAWGLGWGLFLPLAILISLAILLIPDNCAACDSGNFFRDILLNMAQDSDSGMLGFFWTWVQFVAKTSIPGAIGGTAGGLLAGGLTMSVLRRMAPSISWKHMAPSIGIWAIAGAIGLIFSIWFSGQITLAVAEDWMQEGIIFRGNPEVNCQGLKLIGCLGEVLFDVLVISILSFFLLFFLAAFLMAGLWFSIGLLAGRWAVRGIRRMEPSITSAQARRVSISWGCGGVISFFAMIGALILIISLT